MGVSDRLNIPFPYLPIHPLLQFLPRFKKRQLLRFDLHFFPGFRIAPGIGPVFLDEEGTQTTDFNVIPFSQDSGHLIELQIHN